MLMVRASTLTTRVGRSASAAPSAASIEGMTMPRVIARVPKRRLVFFKDRVQHHCRQLPVRLSQSTARDRRREPRSDQRGRDFFSRNRTTASASSRFVGSVSKSRSTTRTAVSGRIAITSRERPADAAERTLNGLPDGGTIAQICFHQIGHDGTRRQFACRGHFHESPGIGGPSGQNAVSRDFTG